MKWALLGLGWTVVLLTAWHTVVARCKRLRLEKRFEEHQAAFEDAMRYKNVALMRLHNDQMAAIVEDMRRI